jgi:hypothetical protein
MNEMDNIYKNETDLYDVLVGHEDYQPILILLVKPFVNLV